MADMNTRSPVLSLPAEVIENILVRLPLKSLGQCRCVCRLWRSLISTPYFANLQLNRTISDPNTNNFRLFTHSPFYSLDYESPSSFEDVDDDSAMVNLGYPLMKASEDDVEVVGSCNGLVCLLYSPDCFVLWNPLTKDARELPKLCTSSFKFDFSGFGHVSSTDDYKVVCARDTSLKYGSWRRINGPPNDDYKVVCASDTKLEVFSLKYGSWRRINGPPNDTVIRGMGTFCNGALHWLGRRGTSENEHNVIVSFDLAEEKYGEILIPVLPWAYSGSILIFEGSLCFVSMFWQEFKAWVMKKCGMQMSWTPLLNLSSAELLYMQPICFTKNGDLIFMELRRLLVRFNLEERTSRYLKDLSPWCERVIYVESLVSPAVGQKRMNQ